MILTGYNKIFIKKKKKIRASKFISNAKVSLKIEFLISLNNSVF